MHPMFRWSCPFVFFLILLFKFRLKIFFKKILFLLICCQKLQNVRDFILSSVRFSSVRFINFIITWTEFDIIIPMRKTVSNTWILEWNAWQMKLSEEKCIMLEYGKFNCTILIQEWILREIFVDRTCTKKLVYSSRWKKKIDKWKHW